MNKRSNNPAMDESKYDKALDVSVFYTASEDYYDRKMEFGKFIEDGRGYRITNPNTPRPWLSFNCNDKVMSLVSNTGKGFLSYELGKNKITRHDPDGYDMYGYPNGRRVIELTGDGVDFDFFASENLVCTVRPGYTEFEAKKDGVRVRVTMFVPEEDTCEIWQIRLYNESDVVKHLKVRFAQDWVGEKVETGEFLASHCENGTAYAKMTKLFSFDEMYAFFTSPDTVAETITFDEMTRGKLTRYTRPSLSREVALKNTSEFFVVSGGAPQEKKANEAKAAYVSFADTEAALTRIQVKWNKMIEDNYCVIPDKNLQNFLNVWLKNQIYLTYRYNRGREIGYRDVMQDAWGYTLVEPEAADRKILEGLSNMYRDGRCPRQYDMHKKENVDARDFSDSPIWIPAAVSSYVNETGDVGILDKMVGFFDGDEKTTVEDHMDRAFDYLYHSRGTNGLVLVREGDWFDGLAHLTKYGADATSVWQTIATYYGQRILADLYEALGKTDKAAVLRTRNEEYKEVVNRVGWDGNWYTYAFLADGEPIGSHKNLEGKIHLNAQTWAIFSGICDDKDRQRRMYKAMIHQLATPYGYQLLAPPYVYYGDRCGRVQRQTPGAFGNGGIYNHGSAFKVYADVALEQYDDALDTFQRALPNHPDNSTLRRTSEPYAVGNNFFGPHSPRFGQNVVTWFTATPAWLIQGGFEQILGVNVGYEGLTFTPHVTDDWDEYFVTKNWRGTKYEIRFVRAEEKGVFVDGEKIEGPLKSVLPVCKVTVQY